MSELSGDQLSPEVLQRNEQEALIAIDWAVHAVGCEAMYQHTGDPDWELLRVLYEEKARCRQAMLAKINQLDLMLEQ